MTTKKTTAKKTIKPTAPAPEPERAVLVTTEHRGVFFGYLRGEPRKESIRLRACRNVVYWSTDVRGFVGLAATGPTKGCRVSKPAGDESTIFDLTSVLTCTDEAIQAFEAAPWSA